MEITDYVRQAGRRAWLLVLLPLLAAALAVPYALSRPTEYTAATTVQLQPNDDDPTPGIVKQTVDSYQAVVTSELTTVPVAERFKLPKDQIAEGATVLREQDGQLVTVSYTGTDQNRVPEISEALARQALEVTQNRDLEIANRDVAAFQGRYDAASKLVNDFIAQGNVPLLPEEDYKSTSAAVATLQRDIARRKALGQDRGDLEVELAALSRSLPPKRDRFVTYQRLQAAANSAAASLAAAQGRQLTVTVRRDAAQPDSEINPVRRGAATEVNALPYIVQVVLGAAVLGLLLAAAILVALEARDRRRRSRTVRRRDPATTAGPAPGRPAATEVLAKS